MITRRTILLAAAASLPVATPARAQTVAGDSDVLALALQLERLEAGLYARGLREVPDLSRAARAFARDAGRHEAEHVAAITDLLGRIGAEAPPEPQLRLGDALRSEAAFLELAQTLEDTGVSAYNGAALLIDDGDVLAVAGQIVQVEARHAGAVRELRGEDPAPAAFDRALGIDDVRRAVAPYFA